VTTTERAIIFVGGTPYSGAGAVAELLGARPDVAMVPAALRFHSDPRGIPALLGGRIGLADFLGELSAGELAQLVGPQALGAAITTFRASYDDDPIDSSRALFWTLLDESGLRGAAATLVDASPGNLLEAHTLARLMPGSRFVHVIRDGRDAATAAAEAKAAPPRLVQALEWWAYRLRDVERGIRGEEDGAPYAIPDARLIMVNLDALASEDGAAAYHGLLDGLRLKGGSATGSNAEPPLDPEAVGRGRWRTYARGPGAWLLSRRYRCTLRELAEEGNHAAEPLLAAGERVG
jgi:sulfotransferase family protein